MGTSEKTSASSEPRHPRYSHMPAGESGAWERSLDDAFSCATTHSRANGASNSTGEGITPR